MSPPLKVTEAGLRAMAQHCQELASRVTSPPPAVAASGWQATGTASGTVDSGAGKAGTVFRIRLAADAEKLTRAADDYAATDEHGKADLTAAAAHIPAGVGGDSGAGRLPATSSAPGSGIDGGAGAFGAGR